MQRVPFAELLARKFRVLLGEGPFAGISHFGIGFEGCKVIRWVGIGCKRQSVFLAARSAVNPAVQKDDHLFCKLFFLAAPKKYPETSIKVYP
jgi:hypothetical protein